MLSTDELSCTAGKLSKAREIFGEDIEFVAMEPPYALTYPTISNGTQALAEVTQPSHNPRSWWDWSSHHKFKSPSEIAFALAHVRSFLERNGPFDACIGFSQGGAMAVLILALLERPWLHPVWDAPAKEGATWPPPPFKAAVLCSAFGPADPEYAAWFKEMRPVVPTLHVIGRNDVVANPSLSLDTAARFTYPEIVWHDGGHHIPRKPYFSHLFKSFLLSHCSPSAAWDDVTARSRSGWGSPTESVASSSALLPPLSPGFSSAHI
ncbi:hypothetical protein JCM5296_004656 [Sporobolomyces johnsonii]